MKKDILNTFEEKLEMLRSTNDVHRIQATYLWIKQGLISFPEYKKIILWWINDSKSKKK